MAGLNTLLESIPWESLPPAWTTFDLQSFSPEKGLWDYQQAALQAALKALWKYYGNLDAEGEQVAYTPGEPQESELARKQSFYDFYTYFDLPIGETLSLGNRPENIALLEPYYELQGDQIPYRQLINRMGFWMATGSGKTLVIVKLLEILWTLMQRGAIPPRDILLLTHREDLIEQFRQQVTDFNRSGRAPFIRLRELRQFPAAKRSRARLFDHQELTVFYYRSDNLSDEQKERILDFRNYDQDGKWYVLLDEAHKGDKEDSKRQHIYNILSRSGFLFNFSATFTDPRDILTTAYEFNLSSFILKGYGKHLSILKQENRAFRDREDYTHAEKQKIVLQSLLILAYVARSRQALVAAAGRFPAAGKELYHRPLELALVNSVNTADADLKLFFRELERIAAGDVTPEIFSSALQDLRTELVSGTAWMYEPLSLGFNRAIFDSLTLNDVLETVFNAPTPGEIEVLERPSNRQELAFKLKSAAVPFALIKIGDVTGWLKDELSGYEIISGFEDESFFTRLNQADSEINLLMGSRSFYEGWDSNRPNVITFINIGTGTEARKFILQSVGRGVRIEPIPGERQRLATLDLAKKVAPDLLPKIHSYLAAVETLHIFGANRGALQTIFTELGTQQTKPEGQQLALDRNEAAIDGHLLLVPTYRDAGQPLLQSTDARQRKFELQPAELTLLEDYVNYLGDSRLLLAAHTFQPRDIHFLQRSLQDPPAYFTSSQTSKRYGSLELILPRLQNYYNLIPKEFDGFKLLEDEIVHFRKIRVLDEAYAARLDMLIRRMLAGKPLEEIQAELQKRYEQGEFDLPGLIKRVAEASQVPQEWSETHNGVQITVKRVAQHYYTPLITALSEDERQNFLRFVITVPSEIEFVSKLEAYLAQPDNAFKNMDWWLFSKLDQTYDQIFIPYYNRNSNQISRFFPDFIFWMQKGDDLYLMFVDPKGTMASDYIDKFEGYEKLFIDGDELKVFNYHGLNVRVGLGLSTNDVNKLPDRLKIIWIDHPRGIFEILKIGYR